MLHSAHMSRVFAQGVIGDSGDIFEKSVGDLTLVGALGAAGGVIGLSTLSFVDEPEDHLDNIMVGAALGIIIGVGWVAYGQAMNTYGDMAVYGELSAENFSTMERNLWGRRAVSLRNRSELWHPAGGGPAAMFWSWQF